MRSSLLFSLLIALLFSACRDDVEEFNVTIDPFQAPAISVNATLNGLALFPSGRVAAGALISSPGLGSTFADDLGRFSFPPGEMDANGQIIFIQADGYALESRTIMPNAGSVMYEEFTLGQWTTGFLNATSGGTAEFDDGVSVTIEPGSARLFGEVYEGDIHVMVSYDAPDDFEAMYNSPGNSRAFVDGEFKVLESYGMIYLEINTPAGENLSIDPQQPAIVRFPIPESMAVNAPDSIDLWFLQENFWQQASQKASLEDLFYIARVTGGGTLNCDLPYELSKVCGRIVNENGTPFPFQTFNIKRSDGGVVNAARTDAYGRFCAWMPRNEDCELVVLDPCTGVQSTYPLGVATGSELDAGDLSASLSNINFMAMLDNCSDGEPIDNNEITVFVNGVEAFPLFNPVMPDLTSTVSFPLCNADDEINIQAVSLNGTTTSQMVRRSADDESPITLNVCSEPDADEFFNLSIGGEAIEALRYGHFLSMFSQTGNLSYQITMIGLFQGQEVELLLLFSDLETGTFNLQPFNLRVRLYDPSGLGEPLFVYSDPLPRTIEITEIGPNQSSMEANFSYMPDKFEVNNPVAVEEDVEIIANFRLNL